MQKLDAVSLDVSISICKTIKNLCVYFILCVAQCYDGTSVFIGLFKGVHAQLGEKMPRLVYVHNHAHRLKLVLTNCLENISELSEFFSVVPGL